MPGLRFAPYLLDQIPAGGVRHAQIKQYHRWDGLAHKIQTIVAIFGPPYGFSKLLQDICYEYTDVLIIINYQDILISHTNMPRYIDWRLPGCRQQIAGQSPVVVNYRP